MSETYTGARRADAREIACTLRDLDTVLQSPALGDRVDGITALRRQVLEVLTEINTDLESIDRINEADTFGTDPTLANQRIQLIRRVERAKIAYEFDIYPALAGLTSKVLDQRKASPDQDEVVTSLTPERPGEPWTVRKVVGAAEQIISSASKAAGILAKGYPLVRALGLLVGVALPPLPLA